MLNNLVFILLMVPAFVWAEAPEVVPGEYIIKFKRGLSASHAQNKIHGKGQLKGSLGRGQMFHLKAGSRQDELDIESLQNDPDVEYVEPNYILRLRNEETETVLESMPLEEIENVGVLGDCPTGVTTDCYRQTGTRLHATEAWAAALPYSAANRPTVAVIDTGIDTTHYVFTETNVLWRNPGEIAGNGVDDDGNGFIDDINGWNYVGGNPNPIDDEGHGTHVSGIVLGATMDILGVRPLPSAKIRIMPLKFLDSSGVGSTSNAINAIYYAVNNGAKVINNSWGGGSYSRGLHDALTYAYSQGVLMVSAAGNYTRNNDVADMYPANYLVPSNVSVAAVYDAGNITSFSNYGVATVHLGAPGSLVYSTVRGNVFGLMSGTSMAAPLVAGAAALAWREAQQLSGYQIKNLLMNSVEVVASLSTRVVTGGRLDILNLLSSTQLQTLTANSQPNYSPVYKAESSGGSSGSSSKGGGCGMIAPTDTNHKQGPGSGVSMGWLAVCLLLPIMLWFGLRQLNPQSRRQYDRFRLSSNIQLKVGDRELTGEMQTLSSGGLSFNVDQALEKGGLVTMKIASPDGKDVIEIEGRIVWNEKDHAYGVQFAQANASIVERVTSWTRKLARTAA